MKKVLFFLFSIGVWSCSQSILENEIIDRVDSNIENNQDAVIFESTSEGLTERGSYKITSASCSAIVNSDCEKYMGYSKLKVGIGSDGTAFTLRDSARNFGSTQGTNVFEVEIPSGQTPVIVAVDTWTDSIVKLRIPKISASLKNCKIKLRIRTADSKRTTTASFTKCLAWYETENAHFGNARWDAAANDTTRAKLGETPDFLNPSWTPQRNNLLFRSDNGKTLGVVLGYYEEVKGTATKPIYVNTVLVQERNLDCKATLKIKKYDFDKTTGDLKLRSKTPELPFTKVVE